MARISPESGSLLVDALEQFLRGALPGGWNLTAATPDNPGWGRSHDYAFIATGPDGTRTLAVIEAKSQLRPAVVPKTARTLQRAKDQLAHGPYDSVTAILIAPFISERSRELLLEDGIGWFDLAGNTRIAAERPALFIERTGADRDPNSEPGDRRRRSLKGPAAARVVRALLDGAQDTRVRALAATAEVGAATSARVLAYLAQERLVERDEHASVQRVHKRSLVQAWARDYRIMTTNHVTPVVVPRGLDWMAEQLVERRLPHVLAGSAALRLYLPEGVAAVTPLSLLAVYSNEVPRLKRELRLRDAEYAANAVLLEPFDEVVLRGAQESGGHHFTAPSQTVADLLTSPGRGPQEAEQLIETLADQDEEWTL
jgi:hypothetical protein